MAARIERTVHVVIDKDRKLTLAFMAWAQAEGIYSVRDAGGACGPDFLNMSYDARHAKRIEQFIIDNEGKP